MYPSEIAQTEMLNPKPDYLKLFNLSITVRKASLKVVTRMGLLLALKLKKENLLVILASYCK